MGEIIAARSMNTLYIIVDVVILTLLAILLLIKKRRLTFLFGVAGGLLYFAVDYGIFYLALGTRQVVGANHVCVDGGKNYAIITLNTKSFLLI